ncbi:uncharacterized protein LOC141860257 [Acropora palmata]|uniref:uncharacterized protein LOC141860257 n=1 Tax=Acropora palmata TaxID=6131 RepID=UPI003DA07C40
MRRRRTPTLIKPQPKVYILGKDGVGKSALLVRFITRRFIGEYARLEDCYTVHVEIENEDMELQIADTAGENTTEKLSLICRQGDMFFVLYSITDRSSFEEAKRIGRFIKESPQGDAVSMVIVANKSDLEHFRRVTFEEGNELSKELNCDFHEVSTAEDCKKVREVVRSSLLNFMRQREKFKETASLKVPYFVKRTPSFEKKPKRSVRNLQDNPKPVMRPFEIHPRLRSKEQGDGVDNKVGSNNNSAEVDGKCLENDKRSKDPLTLSKTFDSASCKNRPFNVEKVKNASQSRERKKMPSISAKTVDGCNSENPKIPFTVHKVKGSSSSEWMRPLPIDKLRAPTTNYWIRTEDQSVAEEKPKASKGPFSLDKLRSQSTEKLRSPSTTNERQRSTSSFSRMKDGLIGRTKALRRKPIYL